jgi:hypothetical protein
MYEVEGKFWTDWDSIDLAAGELRSLGNQDALKEYYFRTFDGAESFTSKISDESLENTPFEKISEYCNEWEQFDYEGEISICNDADGFSLALVDFEMLTALPDHEIVELSVRYYSGFRIPVAAESEEEAIAIVNAQAPKAFSIQDSSENEWEIRQVEIEYLAKLE